MRPTYVIHSGWFCTDCPVRFSSPVCWYPSMYLRYSGLSLTVTMSAQMADECNCGYQTPQIVVTLSSRPNRDELPQLETGKLSLPGIGLGSTKLSRKFSLSPKTIRRKIIARLQQDSGERNGSSESDIDDSTHSRLRKVSLLSFICAYSHHSVCRRFVYKHSGYFLSPVNL